MEQHISVTRAARLAGVTRGEMQARIKRGELASFDGMVETGELLRVYPHVRLDGEVDKALDRVNQIKAKAYAKRVVDRTLPDKEVLARRVTALGRESALYRARAEHYGTILADLQQRLRRLEAEHGEQVRELLGSLKQWLQSALEKGIDGEPDPLLVQNSLLRVLSPQVRLDPGGHEFFVEGADTVLQAALRAGLSPAYGCSNGECGKCRSRLRSGEVRAVREHAFQLGDKALADGEILLCSVTPVTDVEIETRVARTPDDIPNQSIEAEVTAIERPARGVAVLHLKTPRTKRLRFLGGQNARLTVADGSQACLPLASCPCDDRHLQFHLARRADDPFSEAVFERLRVGDTVRVDGPEGDFVAEDSGRALVFVAVDTGYAPIKSLIEHAIALDQTDALHLYWYASGGIGHYDGNLCRAWNDALDGFRFHAITGETGGDAAAWAKRLERLGHDYPIPADRDFYLAGPAPMIEAARKLLLGLGLPEAQLHTEVV